MAPHVTESLSAYMDDELAAPEREAVAAHLRGCPACARHLEELRAVDAAARELPLAVPDGYFEAFRGSLRRRLEGLRPAPRRLAPAWALAAAAAAVVLAVLTPRLLLDRGPAAPASRSVPAPTLGAPAPAPADGRDRVTEAVPEAPRATPPPGQPARPPAGSRLQQGRLEEQEQRPAAAPPATAPPAAPPAVPAPEPAAKADSPAAAANAAAREKKDADELRALGYAGAPAEDRLATTTPATKAEAETDAAGYVAEEAKARRDKAAAAGALQERAAPAGEGRFELLARRTISSAADARSARAAWRAFARDQAAGPHADEARVRAIEAGVEAWRRGRDEKDRAETRDEGRAYLERPDALQRERVRAALKSLER